MKVPVLDRLFEMPHVVINFFFIFMNWHHRFIKDLAPVSLGVLLLILNRLMSLQASRGSLRRSLEFRVLVVGFKEAPT